MMIEPAIVVEDDPDLAVIFTEALEKANYQVETIRDGLSAQRRILQVAPHVVVLDLHIPYISGDEILRQIRTDPRLQHTLVVVATADARMGEALTDVADFVLIKPITFKQLRDLTARLHRT
jgi:two-component system, OmpR family, alkaline phosphatase synthesis response regulator PhoP